MNKRLGIFSAGGGQGRENPGLVEGAEAFDPLDLESKVLPSENDEDLPSAEKPEAVVEVVAENNQGEIDTQHEQIGQMVSSGAEFPADEVDAMGTEMDAVTPVVTETNNGMDLLTRAHGDFFGNGSVGDAATRLLNDIAGFGENGKNK